MDIATHLTCSVYSWCSVAHQGVSRWLTTQRRWWIKRRKGRLTATRTCAHIAPRSSPTRLARTPSTGKISKGWRSWRKGTTGSLKYCSTTSYRWTSGITKTCGTWTIWSVWNAIVIAVLSVGRYSPKEYWGPHSPSDTHFLCKLLKSCTGVLVAQVMNIEN